MLFHSLKWLLSMTWIWNLLRRRWRDAATTRKDSPLSSCAKPSPKAQFWFSNQAGWLSSALSPSRTLKVLPRNPSKIFKRHWISNSKWNSSTSRISLPTPTSDGRSTLASSVRSAMWQGMRTFLEWFIKIWILWNPRWFSDQERLFSQEQKQRIQLTVLSMSSSKRWSNSRRK